VELCWRLREAQFMYLENAPTGKRCSPDKIRQCPGQRDGLFWVDGGTVRVRSALLGPAAFGEQATRPESRALFGTTSEFYPDATALESQAFAFVAWPAEYGIGGIRPS